MAVLLPHLQLTVDVFGHPYPRDEHGVPTRPAEPVETRGPVPGAAKEQPDASWTLRIDPSVWRIWAGDEISDGERRWVVNTAQVYQIPGHPDADYVGVTATLEPPRVP